MLAFLFQDYCYCFKTLINDARVEFRLARSRAPRVWFHVNVCIIQSSHRTRELEEHGLDAIVGVDAFVGGLTLGGDATTLGVDAAKKGVGVGGSKAFDFGERGDGLLHVFVSSALEGVVILAQCAER